MKLIYENNNKEYNKTSRYQILRVIHEDSDMIKYLETYNNVIVPESDDDIYHIVSSSEANRLDIISNKYYNTPTYWWAIALANEYVDPFIINEGDMIRIPSLRSLSDYNNEILTRRV